MKINESALIERIENFIKDPLPVCLTINCEHSAEVSQLRGLILQNSTLKKFNIKNHDHRVLTVERKGRRKYLILEPEVDDRPAVRV